MVYTKKKETAKSLMTISDPLRSKKKKKKKKKKKNKNQNNLLIFHIP